MDTDLKTLNKKIIKCVKCERLVNFRNKIAKQKTKRYMDQDYWGKPIVGFGDKDAKTIVLGLAPAAHGGNRTGRVFTGDKSADFLFKCLFKAKMSNQPTSISLSDGLKLKNIYITVALKCVPPNDKPNSNELKNCFNYLKNEFNYLTKARVVLALGKIAFDSCLDLFNLKKSTHKFRHGSSYKLDDKLKLHACYHPSPRNVNTGRLNEAMMLKMLSNLNKM